MKSRSPKPAPGSATPSRGHSREKPALIPRTREKGGNPPVPTGSSRPCTDLARLPDDLRHSVEQMMVEGATLEDIVETIHERHKLRVTLQAVQNFFRSRLDLQQLRIKRQLETARALKKALGNPQSGQGELADAVLLTGLMRVTRRSAEFRVRDAVFEKYQRENLRLHQQAARLRVQKFNLDKRLLEARLRTEALRSRQLQEKVLDLRRTLESQ